MAELISWDVLDLQPPGRKSTMPLDALAVAIYRRLDAAWGAWAAVGHERIDSVLIENQPSRINGRMKTVQMLIYGYFQMQRFYHNNVGEVVLVSARLKLDETCHLHAVERPNGVSRYTATKRAGEALARAYISGDEGATAWLASFKKKDDACDALLQGVAWCRKRGGAVRVDRCVSTPTTIFALPI
jgi:hypothetical protein